MPEFIILFLIVCQELYVLVFLKRDVCVWSWYIDQLEDKWSYSIEAGQVVNQRIHHWQPFIYMVDRRHGIVSLSQRINVNINVVVAT